MRRWNGWGDENNSMALPDSAGMFLQEILGSGEKLKDATLKEVIAKVPQSKAPINELISTDPEDRVRHATGQSLADYLSTRSGNINYFPDGVCFPTNNQEIQDILALAKSENLDLVPYGGGTSVAGHINIQNSKRAVITVDMSRMNQLINLDTKSNIATFGAGTPGPMVEAQLRAQGFTLGHFPQSFELSTIGGWVASRSSGQQSLRYGRIEQMFAGGLIQTFSGQLEIPTFPASSAGPDLREIILGSEGRFGIISEVKVRVTKLADREDFSVIFFPNWQSATGFCQQAVQDKIVLSMLRVSNATETKTQLKLAGHEKSISHLEKYLNIRSCKNDKCMLTFGITGSKKQVQATKAQIKPLVKKYKGVSTGTLLGKRWAQNRFKFPYLRDALWQKGFSVDTLETATDWQNVDNLLDKVETNLNTCLTDKNVHVFTHLSHVYGQGCSLYTTYVFANSNSFEETYNNWQILKNSTSNTIVNNSGTISHQHGVGKDHAPYLPVEKGPLGIKVIETLCQHFDPNKQLNPGTLLDD